MFVPKPQRPARGGTGGGPTTANNPKLRPGGIPGADPAGRAGHGRSQPRRPRPRGRRGTAAPGPGAPAGPSPALGAGAGPDLALGRRDAGLQLAKGAEVLQLEVGVHLQVEGDLGAVAAQAEHGEQHGHPRPDPHPHPPPPPPSSAAVAKRPPYRSGAHVNRGRPANQRASGGRPRPPRQPVGGASGARVSPPVSVSPARAPGRHWAPAIPVPLAVSPGVLRPFLSPQGPRVSKCFRGLPVPLGAPCVSGRPFAPGWGWGVPV